MTVQELRNAINGLKMETPVMIKVGGEVKEIESVVIFASGEVLICAEKRRVK